MLCLTGRSAVMLAVNWLRQRHVEACWVMSDSTVSGHMAAMLMNRGQSTRSLKSGKAPM
jgi:hypothetical protein